MNIRKTLLEMDKATFNKYDLTHLYESCDLSDKDKQIVVDMLNKHEDAEVIYDNLKKYLSHDNIADDINSITEDYDSKYTKVSSKTVIDSDGFYTDYTWYRDEDGKNVFVFGDPDIYKPEDGDFDFETESNAVAVEWFDDYRGFEDDNDELIEKCKTLKEELPKEHLTIKLSGDTNVFVDERSITDIHEIRKAFLSEFGNTFINNNKQLQDKLMSEVIRVTERIIPEATLELERIDVVDGYAVIDMEVGFVEDKAFEKLTEELSNIIFNWYEGDHLTMEFDINECEINYNDLEEGTVKTRKGKWVNKGKAGTHSTFNTKKEADAQRKAMFASGYKNESLEGEDGWSEDITEITEPFFVEVENAAYELRNTVRGASGFGKTVEDLAELFRGFSDMADDIAERLDDEEETLTEGTETSDKSINESNDVIYDEYKYRYKNALQDIKNVLNSDNIEDIRAYDKESQGEYILPKLFDIRMNKRNMSFEDAKEDVIDFLYRTRANAKSELELRNKRSLESKSIMNKVKSELSKDYKLVFESENTLYFKAPDNSTHDDCIAFVDKVVAASGGEYTATGRGGSWTQWNILTPGGSSIKAGYDYSNKDNYAVYFESILTESRSTKSTSSIKESVDERQEFALEEIEYAFEDGEITQEQRDAAQNIRWRINEEDAPIFINMIEIPLDEIKAVTYGSCKNTEFDGCYVVTLRNGTKKKYGWYDLDSTSSLHLIEELKESVKINEASYGGAYDIADDEYFTKEDGVEAVEEVISILEKEFPELKLEISDMALDNHSLYVVLVDEDGNEFTEEVVIDMRKIRHPLDLIKKYSPILAELFTKEIKEFYNDLNESASKFDLNKLKTEIEDKVKEVMTSPDFGYDSDEVDEYSTVEVKRLNDRVKVEIRAEVTFDGLTELGEACNPIIEKYDKEAYFEPEQPGITNAYLDI